LESALSHRTDKQDARLSAAEVLRIPETVSLRVGGCSMLPTLWPGDVIAVRLAPDCDVSPGKLVVYPWEGPEEYTVQRVVRWDPDALSPTTGVIVNMFTVHRVVRHEPNVLITRGDALPADDPPVQRSQIFGEVIAIQRGKSRLIPAEQLTGSQKAVCYFLRRSLRLRRLLLRLHSFWRAMRRLPAPPRVVS